MGTPRRSRSLLDCQKIARESSIKEILDRLLLSQVTKDCTHKNNVAISYCGLHGIANVYIDK